MAFLDRFRRRKKRQKRAFAGANTGRLFADFVTSNRSADAEIRPALRTLRQRCRDLARNDEYVRRFITLLKTNVVGENGVSLQSAKRDADGSLDALGNAIIERGWKAWGRLGSPTVDGGLSWIDAQRLFIETLARDGEVLVRFVQGDTNPDGFQIEFVEADLLDEELNSATNERTVRMGVESNSFGKPVAYHLLKYHPGDTEFVGAGRKHTRIEADRMLHVFQPERAHQTRGVPMMAASIASLKMLHGYREAELIAARVAASKMGFFTSPDGDGYTGDEVQDTYAPVMSAEPGSFEQLPNGVSLQTFDPTHPTTAFAEFHKSLLRSIASGLGVSYNALANDLESTSYSSVRAGAIDERDFYKTLQRFTIEHFVEPVFRRWLQSAMTRGSVNLPISKYDLFADRVVFRPRGFSWVDPLKEINANVAGLRNGILSLQDIASGYGRDVEDVFRAIEREKELAERHGISMGFEPFGAPQAAVAPVIAGED